MAQPPTRTRILVVALICTFASGACGGGGPLTKEEMIQKADEICAGVNERTQGLEQPTTAEEFDAFIEQAKQISEDALGDLRDLEPPPDDSELIATMLDRIEEALGYLDDIAQATRDQDQDAMEEIGEKVAAAADEAQSIAEDYGFVECGRPVTPGESG